MAVQCLRRGRFCVVCYDTDNRLLIGPIFIHR